MTTPAGGNGTLVAEGATPTAATGPAPYASLVPVPTALMAPRVPGLPVPRALSLVALGYAYRKRQMAIADQTQRALANLWSQQIDPSHFADSWQRLNPLAYGIVRTHYDATAADAASYYQTTRVMADLGHRPVPPVELDAQYAQRVMNSMSAGTFFHQVKEVDSQEASDIASRALQGASTRLVLSGGRETIATTAGIDPDAQGWERIVEPGSCGFCAMLAGRGGVYKSSTVDFRAHDHCRCLAQVVFKGQESANKDLSDQWASVTRGRHGAAARAAWDKHWEGRHDNPIQPQSPSASGRREIRAGQQPKSSRTG